MAARNKNIVLRDENMYMAIALIARQLSTDPKCQVGACLLDIDNKVIGTGHNCMPKQCEEFSWLSDKDAKDPLDGKHNFGKHKKICQVQVNLSV